MNISPSFIGEDYFAILVCTTVFPPQEHCPQDWAAA